MVEEDSKDKSGANLNKDVDLEAGKDNPAFEDESGGKKSPGAGSSRSSGGASSKGTEEAVNLVRRMIWIDQWMFLKPIYMSYCCSSKQSFRCSFNATLSNGFPCFLFFPCRSSLT